MLSSRTAATSGLAFPFLRDRGSAQNRFFFRIFTIFSSFRCRGLSFVGLDQLRSCFLDVVVCSSSISFTYGDGFFGFSGSESLPSSSGWEAGVTLQSQHLETSYRRQAIGSQRRRTRESRAQTGRCPERSLVVSGSLLFLILSLFRQIVQYSSCRG